MAMTAAEIVTIISAFGVLATIIGGVIVKIISVKIEANTAMTNLAAVKAEETNRKADSLLAKTSEIHTLTNSNLSKVTASLAVALEKIEGLQQVVTSMRDAKVVADRVQERADTRQRVTDDPPSTAPKVLQEIEANTAETAANTARTEDKVDALTSEDKAGEMS